ncbi:hypothetical protein D0859_16901 [Hortaea werneckii]|uniref:Uncharacterized protein n=1 Tax=Hortaea werneckii TaxID=91943 RepID=A0A3M7I0Y9_HORWE|nr:hypothetical protein D0859_16901 [Hortaea werneckii]
MLTQTLPTLRTSHPTKSPPCSTHHHRPAATHANFPPTTPPSSLNSSSTPSTSDPRMPHLPPELWLQIFPPILSSREELTNLHLDGRDEHAHEHEHGEGTKPHHQPVPPLSSSPPASSSAWRRTAGPPPFVSRAETTTPLSSSSPSTLPSALERHTTRLTHLHSLPPPALALLLFKLHTALRILRVLGPYPLRTTSTPSQHGRPWDSTTPQEIEMEEVWHDGNGAGLTRCEVEVAVEECLLGYGPEVLVGLVEGGDRDGDRDGGEKRGEEQQKQEQEQQRRRRQRRGRWARRYVFFFFLSFFFPHHLAFPLSSSAVLLLCRFSFPFDRINATSLHFHHYHQPKVYHVEHFF